MVRERDVPDPVDSDVLDIYVSVAWDEVSLRVLMMRQTV